MKFSNVNMIPPQGKGIKDRLDRTLSKYHKCEKIRKILCKDETEARTVCQLLREKQTQPYRRNKVEVYFEW